jgi:rubrerythrin
MYQNFGPLINEAIQLELNVARLYLLFHKLLPEDATFWWALVIEEENHAAILRTIEQMETSQVEIPDGIMPNGLTELQKANRMILKAMEDFERQPDRAYAFQLAYKIEMSAGESHYNNFMNNAAESRIVEIFRTLNRDDLDHAQRIQEYKKEHLDS